MEDMALWIYSDGDLFLGLCKIVAFIIMFMALSVILGCIRGLRL